MKMSQWSRFCLSGLAVLMIMLSVVLQPQHAFSQLSSPLPTPTPTASDEIDLSIDEDHDGMPDQLKAAVQEYEDVYTAVAKKGGDPRNDPASLDALQKAHDKMVRRLPYSGQTRAAQKRLAQIYDALSKAPDQATQAKLWAEERALQVQMQQDPNFALVDQLVSRRLLDKLNGKSEPGKVAPNNATPPQPTSTPIPVQSMSTDATNGGVVQAAAANGGAQTIVPISWNEFFLRDSCAHTSAPDFTQLVRGEIMFYAGDNKNNNFFYAKKFSHIGMYDRPTNNIDQVYEANPEDGVKLKPRDANWKTSGSCVAIARVTGTTAQQRQSALTYVEGVYGTLGQTPYNYILIDKGYPIDSVVGSLYCSQLIWKVFGHLGIDLDSNDGTYATWLTLHFGLLGFPYTTVAAGPVVAPDEIYLHPSVLPNVYTEGTW
ncbi:MAG: YiiX/YebB-like N1pC/P60 family cysteine hydrolase [Caldilineaceae bacterium]